MLDINSLWRIKTLFRGEDKNKKKSMKSFKVEIFTMTGASFTIQSTFVTLKINYRDIKRCLISKNTTCTAQRKGCDVSNN